MEFLCHACATDHIAPLKDTHAQSRHAEIRGAGQAIVAGSNYDGIEIGHGFAITVEAESQHNIAIAEAIPIRWLRARGFPAKTRQWRLLLLTLFTCTGSRTAKSVPAPAFALKHRLYSSPLSKERNQDLTT
jgi:hypothetical protein